MRDPILHYRPDAQSEWLAVEIDRGLYDSLPTDTRQPYTRHRWLADTIAVLSGCEQNNWCVFFVVPLGEFQVTR